ncbi:hypothetical protein K227x_46280 [Rubripirellula lacrimiformis]|uniref:Uncharacterized protein n=1 Tax=Rubripirellula lacrimiformis TaxID=1930273 RepID=A0A517NGG0_9BACT|nr:hypothetical protein K227x_46280 [Rubripirellula lacrimiformis]
MPAIGFSTRHSKASSASGRPADQVIVLALYKAGGDAITPAPWRDLHQVGYF